MTSSPCLAASATSPRHRYARAKVALVGSATALLLAAASTCATAAGPSEGEPALAAPIALVRVIIDETLSDLSSVGPADSGWARRAAQAVVSRVVGPHVDFESIARRLLGKHWHHASAAQRGRFLRAYEQHLLNAYCDILLDYTEVEVKYVAAVLSRSGRTAKVDSRVYTSFLPFPISVTYWLSRSDTRWRLIDIKLQGVSLIDTNAASFVTTVERAGFDGLLELLGRRQS